MKNFHVKLPDRYASSYRPISIRFKISRTLIVTRFVQIRRKDSDNSKKIKNCSSLEDSLTSSEGWIPTNSPIHGRDGSKEGGNESGLYLSEYRRRRLSFLQPPRLIVTPGGGPGVPANKRPADDLAHIPSRGRGSFASRSPFTPYTNGVRCPVQTVIVL